jgi:UDP:flavonoid glycosyltransferase YjiC (YdhE family)
MTDEPLTIMFWPESAYGPTNQCIGLAAVLRERGHTIVFAAESSWAGKLAPFGFIEELVDLAAPAEGAADEDAGKFWADFIAETAPEFRKPTIEQLQTFIQPTYQALIDGAKYSEPRLREIIATHQPDVIVEDNVVLFPALATAGVPFVRIVSCSPLEIAAPQVPPPFSGLPSADSAEWDTYRAEFDRAHRSMWSDFNAWVQAQGAPALPDLECHAPTPPICTSTRPRPTIGRCGPWTTAGSGWTPVSAKPTTNTSFPPRSPTAPPTVR